GKSTLLKVCVGFERPTAGSVRVLGADPVRERAAAVRALGYVPQTPSLYRDMRIRDHLDYAAATRHGFDAAYAADRLASLDVDLGAVAGQLSGGQQAQVSLAIALGTRAPILLLDEPLASLDPLARREFLGVVRDAARTGDVTIVLSSHVLSEIEGVADRLLVLGEGRVLFDDTAAASVGQHRVLDESAALDGLDVVAAFPGHDAVSHVLVRSTDPGVGRRGSLEEVVIGYLALGRKPSRAAATAPQPAPQQPATGPGPAAPA
ncbi:MAG TPA: ABC transporter ATP-binding protein, partial [Candidatus Limnocylindrales bacterium]|nr:ABC transporter ATP-binding protein [Candidatus Limnocylindrales bacterium]